MLAKIKGAAGPGNNGQNVTAASAAVPQEATGPVQFSASISSEKYGLSGPWWISELVKLAAGATSFALIVLLYVGLGVMEEGVKWNMLFWIWLGALVLSVIYRLTYLWLWKMHYKYEFGPEYIYIKEGVLSVSEKNMAYKTIQDVKVNQTIIDRIFGVADVIIENASPSGMVPALAYGKRSRIVPINGIVLEGLSVTDARQIAEEVKSVILRKGGLTQGL
jgi:membrane protein YdbS with pleckstrin-like domain